MKKLCVALALAMCLCLCGCETTVDETPGRYDFWGKYIVIKRYYNDEYGALYETYDKDTHVRYDIWSTNQHKSGITPIYNSDGTPMLYDGE